VSYSIAYVFLLSYVSTESLFASLTLPTGLQTTTVLQVQATSVETSNWTTAFICKYYVKCSVCISLTWNGCLASHRGCQVSALLHGHHG